MKIVEYILLALLLAHGALIAVIGVFSGYPMTFTEIQTSQFVLQMKTVQLLAFFLVQLGLLSGWLVVRRIRDVASAHA